MADIEKDQKSILPLGSAAFQLDRIIDIGEERKKPQFVTLAEYAEIAEQYTENDLLNSEKPYWDLIEIARNQTGLFAQYSNILLSRAGENPILRKHIADRIDIGRLIIEVTDETNNILGYINRVEADEKTKDKVSVLPLLCGSGKSTAITMKIKEVVERNDGTGMIIVTDSTDRLQSLWNADTQNPFISDDDKAFIKSHKDAVTVVTSETYVNAMQKQAKHPVLAMTTQRYFNVLTQDEIQEFLHWGNGNRTLILIDEEPLLNEVVDLTPKIINDIDTMIRMLFHNINIGEENKKWCVQQWDAFRSKFLNLLQKYEYSEAGNIFFYEDNDHSLTEDDDRFFKYLNDNKCLIRTDNVENFKNIHVCKAFMDTWGIYSHRSAETGAYESKFSVYYDNSNKVRDIGAKVIILDATGDISPVYSGQEYIDMRDGVNYLRTLSPLTIMLGDIDTSKHTLSQIRCPVPAIITSYLNDQGYNESNSYLFTYKSKETRFCKGFPKRTEHFGNIKGKNEYASAECIAQVGLNEMQPVQYLVHLLARDTELLSRLHELQDTETCAELIRVCF